MDIGLNELLVPVAVYVVTEIAKRFGAWDWVVSRKVTLRGLVLLLSAGLAVVTPVIDGGSVDPLAAQTFATLLLGLVGAEGLYRIQKKIQN